MASKKIGKQTFALCNPPSIAGHANVVGPKEGDGPLKDSFDVISPDASFGERSWEKAEVEMQKRALAAALENRCWISSLPGICSTSASAPATPPAVLAYPSLGCTVPVPPWRSPWDWRRCYWMGDSASGGRR